MKRIPIYLLLLGTVVNFSCDEQSLLNLSPQTYQSSSSFFKSGEHFEQALIGVYSCLRSLPEYAVFMDEMRSDNTFFTFFAGDRSQALHAESIAQFTDDDRASYTTNRYTNNYVGISRANTILDRITGFSDMEEATKNRIVAETLFLRAFFYFDLVSHYGGVPLQLAEITSEEGTFLPRATEEEVYGQVIADLVLAIPGLPVAKEFPQSGRASSGSAKMLLAYAYLTQPNKDYAKAAQELRDIEGMNYTLMADYADCFDPAQKNSRESIFEIQYKEGNDGLHSYFTWLFIPKTPNTVLITGLNVATQHIRWGGWNVPTRDLVSTYEKGDKRLNASVAVAEGTEDANGTFLIERVVNAEGYKPQPGKAYYYFVNKYNHSPYAVEYNTGENWPIFRYADALLLLAECLLEQGDQTGALRYVNQVRNRAGLANLATISKEAILKERRHELAFENHRWLDLIRAGKAVEVMQQFGAAVKSQYGWVLPNAFNVTPEKLIYPIPFRELQINSNLVQNPGYQ
ncbi:RagB/SusD family nutrient uptake outer membrane protein [Parapedobacter indicus]|uniref:Starch-binding associating with outer membrane n=1 Tax=Parapedobacter indicus TaxID=1477437 RepID=A0A1I3GNA3_9SPHI|nr:RagB/SusD family nutrient uptake outer membrane protein [Parapedobacter indicus]PPL02719.1 putative outer membrane starch-binding protein [Parapedobacter indicus]SFI24896.1 Starch-binding associating with outer membrane [Parapedobacter indicus]